MPDGGSDASGGRGTPRRYLAIDVPAEVSSLPAEPAEMTPHPDPPMKYGKPEMSVAGQMFVATVAVLTSLSAVILVLWQLLMGGAD